MDCCSLDKLERGLSNYARENVTLVYWNNRPDVFDYMLEMDQKMYTLEFKQFRHHKRKGTVPTTTIDEPHYVCHTVLFPIEIIWPG